jgi:outer membrane protein OmpA-like peptidoglycan-associated protein
MIDRSQIREHMDVIASDGGRIGAVDSVDGDRIKLTRKDSPDGEHHYVSFADVERIDQHVHLRIGRSAVFGAAAAGAGAAAAGATGTAHAAGASSTHDAAGSPLPPIKNPAVDAAKPRRNYMLPWVLLGAAILALLLALSQCGRDGEKERSEAVARDQANQANAASTAAAGAGTAAAASSYREGSFGYDVDQYLASDSRDERAFTFQNLNFDKGSAAIRDVDKSDLADLSAILIARPGVRAAIVGYTDSSGDAAANAELGAARARAVIAALGSRGVDTSKLEARTGGEKNPVADDSNAGMAENRRTEFVVLSR